MIDKFELGRTYKLTDKEGWFEDFRKNAEYYGLYFENDTIYLDKSTFSWDNGEILLKCKEYKCILEEGDMPYFTLVEHPSTSHRGFESHEESDTPSQEASEAVTEGFVKQSTKPLQELKDDLQERKEQTQDPLVKLSALCKDETMHITIFDDGEIVLTDSEDVEYAVETSKDVEKIIQLKKELFKFVKDGLCPTKSY